jgi:hypothetical protein
VIDAGAACAAVPVTCANACIAQMERARSNAPRSEYKPVSLPVWRKFNDSLPLSNGDTGTGQIQAHLPAVRAVLPLNKPNHK